MLCCMGCCSRSMRSRISEQPGSVFISFCSGSFVMGVGHDDWGLSCFVVIDKSFLTGKSASSFLKKCRRRSAVGTRGSPETNHLIRFIAQQRSLKSAGKSPLAQDTPFQVGFSFWFLLWILVEKGCCSVVGLLTQGSQQTACFLCALQGLGIYPAWGCSELWP